MGSNRGAEIALKQAGEDVGGTKRTRESSEGRLRDAHESLTCSRAGAVRGEADVFNCVSRSVVTERTIVRCSG